MARISKRLAKLANWINEYQGEIVLQVKTISNFKEVEKIIKNSNYYVTDINTENNIIVIQRKRVAFKG